MFGFAGMLDGALSLRFLAVFEQVFSRAQADMPFFVVVFTKPTVRQEQIDEELKKARAAQWIRQGYTMEASNDSREVKILQLSNHDKRWLCARLVGPAQMVAFLVFSCPSRVQVGSRFSITIWPIYS